MAYQALYRQWRPKNFSGMVAQEAVISTLRNQVMTGRVAHAYLFCGSRGTGKTSTAKILARAINCENPVNGDPCGECESCKRLLADESMDVMEIDAASNNGVDEIRDLRETVKYPPQQGKKKVYIIDEVHMLSTSAFNALLKTLEEPPAYVVFILATTEPQKLPATILSRCQRFDFGRIPARQIAGRLREAVDGANAQATDNALMMIARAAEGGMRDALSILDMCLGYSENVTEELVRSVLGTSDRSFLFRFAEAMSKEDASGVMRMIDELMRAGREPMVFAKDVSQHLRSLLIAKCSPDDLTVLLDLTKEDALEYETQGEQFSTTRLMRMLELFMHVETDLRWSSSPRIVLENAALKSCLRTEEADTVALNERIALLEKQLSDLQEKLKSCEFTSVQPQKRAAKLQENRREPEKSSAQPVMTPTGKTDADAWKEAMNLLKRSDPGTYAMLTMGKYAGCAGNVYRWEAPTGQEFYVGLLNNEKKKNSVIESLMQASGMACNFEATAHVEEKKNDDGDAAFVNELENVFGKANTIVQEKLKG